MDPREFGGSIPAAIAAAGYTAALSVKTKRRGDLRHPFHIYGLKSDYCFLISKNRFKVVGTEFVYGLLWSLT